MRLQGRQMSSSLEKVDCKEKATLFAVSTVHTAGNKFEFLILL